MENQKIANNQKPKPRVDEKPIAEESAISKYMYMKPNGNGTPDRNDYAVNKLFKTTVEKLVGSLNSKSKDIDRIDISITLTTNSSNKMQIQDLRDKIQKLFPKAKVEIEFDPKYKTPNAPGVIPSDEDFGYKIQAKGYKTKKN